MIDTEISEAEDRALHAKFFEVFKQNTTAVNLWPPMDVYELFYRAGRHDAEAETLARLQTTSQPTRSS